MQIYQRENGVWYLKVSRTRKKSLKTRDEATAKALFAALQEELRDSKVAPLDPSPRKTLAQWRDEYLAGRTDLSPATLSADRVALGHLEAVLGPGFALRALTPERLDQVKRVLRARGVSRVSVNAYLRHIRACLNAAAEAGHMDPVRVKGLKTGHHLPRILTREERGRLLAHLAEKRPELARIVRFALWTACRQAEILGLTWPDVKGESALIRGKGDRHRVIPLLSGALEAMGPRKDLGPVFHQYNRSTVSHYFLAACRALGIEDVHFHNLRHTAGTAMLEAGTELALVQKMMGHARIQTTLIYAQVLDDHLRRGLADYDPE